MQDANEDIQAGHGDTASGHPPIDALATIAPIETDMPSSLAGMGMAIENALHYVNGCLTRFPDHPEALLLLGTIHTWQKQFDQAVPPLRRATALMPDNAEALNTLGLALLKTGRIEEAISSFHQAIALQPEFPSARARLTRALAARGNDKTAIEQFRAVLAIEAGNEAIARHRATLAADPHDMSALNSLGKALWTTGRHEDAIAQFRAGLALNPTSTETARNLVQLLVERDRVEEAIACYRSVLEHDPSLYAIHAGTGTLLRKVGRHAEAQHHLEQACALRPDEAPVRGVLALILQERGQIDAAIAQLRRAVALAPDEPNYYLGLVRLTKLTPDDPILAALLKLAEREESFADAGRMHLHFALGKALADTGQHRASFDHQLKGNAIRRATVPYDEQRVIKAARVLREQFTAETIAATAATGHPSPRPVFIVGMPRSGSTLVEQILASHPDVYGAGEVGTLADTLQDAAKRLPGWTLGTSLHIQSQQDRHAIAEDYLHRMDRLVTDWTANHPPAFISNKMLDNFFHIGLIRQLWPNARIIHTFRDPLDTCLSCFSIPFDKLDFTFDLGELGRYYRQYQTQMAHWHQVLPPGSILDVRYEDIVDDLETNARRIIAYCGLPWDDACLSFHQSRRLVRTSSVAQVRKPIYRTAVGRWRPDDETLRPLLDALAGDIPAADHA